MDNIDKIANDLANRSLSLQDSNEMADYFEAAIGRVICFPGDWHTGLAMVQSINNIFWDAFLEPIKKSMEACIQ